MLASAESNVLRGLSHLFQSGTGAFWNHQDSHLTWQGPAIVGVTALGSFSAYKTSDEPTGTVADPVRFGSMNPVFDRTGILLPAVLPAIFFSSSYIFDKDNPYRHDFVETAEELAESLAFTFVSAGALKLIVDRQRPNGGKGSFPSGHTAMSFAAAGVLAQKYPWYVAVPSLAFASAVGYSRMDSRSHYFSDVIAGAGLGMLFATSVRLFHGQQSENNPPTTVIPVLSPSTVGVQFNRRF